MYNDALNALSAVQTEMRPGVAGVRRAIHAVAIADAVPRVALAGAKPQHIRIRWRQRQCADAVGLLLREELVEGHAAVGRTKHTAVSARHVKRGRIARHTVNVGYPATHVGRTNRPPLNALYGAGRVLGGCLGVCDASCGNEND